MLQPTVIVGSGLGGLVCAIELARRGHSVLVLERSHEPGGRARSPLNGAHLQNSGPRAVYLKGALHRFLRAQGVDPPGFSPSTSGILGVLDGALVPVPGGAPRLLRTSWLSMRGKRELGLALARITMGALDAHANETVGRWIERHLHDSNARNLVATLVRVSTYDANPAQPAERALAQTRNGLVHGVRYVDGGWAAIAEALVEIARSHGVRFERATVTCATADGVELDDGRAIGGRVIIAAGLGIAALTGARVVKESAVSCLDLVLDRLPFPERRLVLGIDAPLYLSVHSRPEVARDVRVHAMSYVPAAREELERFLDLAQPGWRACVLASRYLPHMVVSRALDTTAMPAGVALVHDDGAALLADGVVECALRVAASIVDAERTRAA